MGQRRIKYLTLHRGLLNPICVFSGVAEDGSRKVCCCVYQSTIIVYLILRLSGEISLLVSESGSWPEVIPVCIFTTCAIFRCMYLCCKRDDFLDLLHFCEDKFIENSPLETNERVIKKWIKKNNRFMTIVVSMLLLVAFHWVAYPMISYYVSPDDYVRKLPTMARYPIKNQYETPVYEIIYVIQSFLVFFATYVMAAIEACLASFCTITCSQILELHSRLRRISRIEKSLRGKPKFGQMRLESELERCIIHHREIIRFVNKLEIFFGPIVIIEYISLAVPVCAILYQASTASWNDTKMLVWLEYFSICIGQMYILCAYGHELTISLLGIRKAVMEGLNAHMSTDIKWKLHFMLMQCNMPKHLTGRKMIVLSLDLFKAVLGYTISNFVVLRNIRSSSSVVHT